MHPIYPARDEPAAIFADMPEGVEVLLDRGMEQLEAFLQARRGYFDTVWIGRTHNLDRLLPMLQRRFADLDGARIVLDTEAVAAGREAAKRRLARGGDGGGEDGRLDAAIRAELANAWFCHGVVAVNAAEAGRLAALGLSDVRVLGHARQPAPGRRGFAERAGLLFVGAFPAEDAPNTDALRWFAEAVLPRIEAELGHETRLTVAGFVGTGVDLAPLGRHPRISLRGPLPDLTGLFGRHRVFVAPTRFAAGIPYKLHEAAALGLPAVATELLRGQLGWEDGRDLLSVAAGDTLADAEAFARAVVRLYRDEALWTALRDGALARISAECDPAIFAARARAIAAGLPTPAPAAEPMPALLPLLAAP
jgi:hypothetical protein